MTRSSAQRKFLRGVEQVKTLCGEADAFQNGDAYTFSEEVETRTPKHLIYRCYATERKPIPDHWPLLAGEAIHNLRSSLDHAVFAASGRDDSAFPICLDPTRFKNRSRQTLNGVPAAMRATIERAQPYRNSPSAPSEDFLEQLRTLSNIDKHRTLATVATAVWYEGVGARHPTEITWEKYASHEVLSSGKTHISTFTATSPTEINQMEVHTQFAYEVRIEGRPLDMLIGIIRQVFRVLTECETGKPPSPLATYPI